jgi:hypothetical protein
VSTEMAAARSPKAAASAISATVSGRRRLPCVLDTANPVTCPPSPRRTETGSGFPERRTGEHVSSVLDINLAEQGNEFNVITRKLAARVAGGVRRPATRLHDQAVGG